MPTYCYRISGSEEVIEISHPASELPHTKDSQGRPLERVYTAPNLGLRHTPKQEKARTSNENLGRLGFTKYTRDKVTGRYHKEVGKGPAVIQAQH